MTDKFPKLAFLDWHEDDEILIRQKGWFCHNRVKLENGNRYQVCFFDSTRLNQELEMNSKNGKPYFIESSLIVLSELTIENMQKAITEAEKRGFFENLKPIDK